VFTVADAAEHVILLVPHEGINHVLNLLDLWLVHLRQEHVAVAINEAHFPLARHLYLVQIHLNDLSRVLNLTRGWLARLDIENTDDLGLRGIDERQNVTTDGQMALIEELNAKA